MALTGCQHLPPPAAPRPASNAWPTPATTALWQQWAQLHHASGTPYDSGFALLQGAQPAFSSRLALIEQASRTLDVQYYAIHADPSSARLLRAMVQAAQRGVRVRVLLDDFHTAGADTQVLQLAWIPGIEVRLFNPLLGPRSSTVLRALSTLGDFDRTQQRMHNKLFIADNAIGITGGRNLGDAYFDGLHSNNFVDLDILAAGAVVPQLSHSFDRFWNDPRAYSVHALYQERTLRRLSTPATPLTSRHPTAAAAPRPSAAWPAMDLAQVPWIWAPSVVLADAPSKIRWPHVLPQPELPALHSGSLLNAQGSAQVQALRQQLPSLVEHDTVIDGLLSLIARAQRELLIISPYFVPGPDMKAAFATAVQRGVQVRILTNSLASNDAPLAHAGYARHRRDLLRMGVQLYEMRSTPGAPEQSAAPSTVRTSLHRASGAVAGSRAMLHSKLLVIDGMLTVVGSMNLDMRSQLHNTEVALLIASHALAQEAAAHITSSLQRMAWRVVLQGEQLHWTAPACADWGLRTQEPDASAPLRWLLKILGPLAPDHLL